MVIDFICSLCKIFTKFKFLKVLSHAFFYILYGPCIYVKVCVTSHISFCAWFEVGVEVNFFFLHGYPISLVLFAKRFLGVLG